MPEPPCRDIIAVGASFGGVEAVRTLVSKLPEDLPAAVLVVIHIPPGLSALPEILTRAGPLRAAHALHGETIVSGRIYVAPPDNHILVRPGYLQVVRGPKENGHRPAVDALFRTASTAYGPRVVGVVLTGFLDCGTAGLLSIKARGGLAVVQDPSDAAAPSMPESAIAHVEVDHVLPLAQIGPLLSVVACEPAPAAPLALPRALMELEGDELGTASVLVCPACQGKLTEAELNGFAVLRCHVGHAYSLRAVAADQAEEVERALWAAMRALEESAALSRKFAERARGDLRRRLGEKAESQCREAEVLRRILLSEAQLTREDAETGGDPVAPALAD